MSENEPNKSSGLRQSLPLPTYWFEFLLNPSLLEEHLQKDKPEPSATDLIIQFLVNASLPKEREQTTFPPVTVLPLEKSENSENVEEVKENRGDNKKETALKLLAHRAAAFLKWDLNILQLKLPLPMQNTLLNNLLCLCLDGEYYHLHPKYHLECLEAGVQSMSDQMFFSVNLFHRWCARTILSDAFIAKPMKTAPIAVPGYQDNTSVAPSVMDSLLKTICEFLPDSKQILTKCLNLQKNIRIPSFHTFDTLSEEKSQVTYFWEKGTLIDNQEIICQTAYDLGCLHFYQREYSQAGELFFKSYELYSKMKDPLFCRINEEILKGYTVALGTMLKKPVVSMVPTLTERLKEATELFYENIIPILLEDNIKCEIPIVYREQVANDIAINDRTKLNAELHFQVRTLNIIRWLRNSHTIVQDYVSVLLSRGESGVRFLHMAVSNVYKDLNWVQKHFVKNFLRYVIRATFQCAPIISIALNDLQLFGEVLCRPEVDSDSDKLLMCKKLNSTAPRRDFSGHPALLLGELEVQLQTTYDPQKVWELIPRLHSLGLRRPAWHIAKRWELAKPFHTLIVELQQGYVQEATYVLVAKVRELARLKQYGEARHILEAVDREVSDKSFKLTRLVWWEILYLDLMHLSSLPVSRPPSETWVVELVKQTKACLSLCLQDKGSMDILPRTEIVEECAILLLNTRNWEYLASLVVERGSFTELLVILSSACGEVAANKNARKAARELWDVVLPMFATSTGQQKRSLSGIQSLVNREVPNLIMPRNVFNCFVEKLRESTVLSLLISLLSKIHNILKDDPNNTINMDLAAIWPSVIGNSFGIRLVQESLSIVLNHALKLHPTNVAWLKANADLNYVTGHHADALKYYLEGAMLSSDYFSVAVPRSSLDEIALRRCIRCCSQLQCHTQAGILCQFLDEVDYTTAFKCLQEKSVHDAMDTYYDCIWDLSILEFIVYIHTKRGEVSKKELALRLIGQTELNANNNAEIQREASNVRKSRFLRAIVAQYL